MPAKRAVEKEKATKAKGAKEKAPLLNQCSTPEQRNAILDRLIAEAKKEYGEGCVGRSEDMFSSYMLRRPTGLISLDLAMAGGWPAAAPSVLVGPDGVGKDYLLWRTAAESQRIFGEDFCMACYFTEFKPDKKYMKDYCGFQIAMSEDEITELNEAKLRITGAELTNVEIDHYRHQIGTFIPIVGISADHGFDQIFKFLDANICQIIAVNSIGSLQTEAKEKVESFEDFAQQRNEASLLSKVMPKFSMYMNSKGSSGRPNETSLILVNQVRSQDAAKRQMPGRPQQDKDTYKTASNSWALKHNKAIELFMHNGPKIYDLSVKPPMALGRLKHWEITKGKLGTHEGLRGEFEYLFGYGADILGDLVNTALRSGVLELDGTWIKYDFEGYKLKTQGAANVLEVLRKQPAFAEHLKERLLMEAEVLCRYQ